MRALAATDKMASVVHGTVKISPQFARDHCMERRRDSRGAVECSKPGVDEQRSDALR